MMVVSLEKSSVLRAHAIECVTSPWCCYVGTAGIGEIWTEAVYGRFWPVSDRLVDCNSRFSSDHDSNLPLYAAVPCTTDSDVTVH
jgi:hypothetical protein